ncbi:hypothetical protein ACHAXS_007593 [Conticribra weissflogii]
MVPTDVPSASPTRYPTKTPTSNPTPSPTPHPTSPPITASPIAGNVAIHGKSSDGTPRPTRSPVTSRPTSPPTSSITSSPVASIQKAPSSSSSSSSFYCTDDHGIYINHLGNPKDCAWLDNDKDGYTDRKDKNCGSESYHMTELGAHCQATCALYNGCIPGSGSGSMVQMSQGNSGSNAGAGAGANTKINNHVVEPSSQKQQQQQQQQDSEEPTLVTICADRLGTYLNHLSNPKTCEWLYNDKEGKTDRKDKNCGGPDAAYPITELGMNCPATCIDYNGDGCSDIEVYPNDTGSGSGGGSNSDSSGGSKTVRISGATLTSSTACVNGSGYYLDHIGVLKQCQWLHGDNPSSAKSRQQKNCGTEDYPITELGTECPWSCQDYNGCNQH